MKINLTKAVGGILLGVVLLAALAACGGSTGGTTPASVTPLVTATSQPTATPTATVARSPTTSPAGSSSNDLLTQGKLVFEKTAGGVGCAYCHGLDGTGKGPSGLNAPDIRGAAEARVRNALTGVPAMSFIKLSEAELKAALAYLQYLNQ